MLFRYRTDSGEVLEGEEYRIDFEREDLQRVEKREEAVEPTVTLQNGHENSPQEVCVVDDIITLAHVCS